MLLSILQPNRLLYRHVSWRATKRWWSLYVCGSTSLLESKVHMKSALLVASQWGLACEVVIFELLYYECHICNSNNALFMTQVSPFFGPTVIYFSDHWEINLIDVDKYFWAIHNIRKFYHKQVLHKFNSQRISINRTRRYFLYERCSLLFK